MRLFRLGLLLAAFLSAFITAEAQESPFSSPFFSARPDSPQLATSTTAQGDWLVREANTLYGGSTEGTRRAVELYKEAAALDNGTAEMMLGWFEQRGVDGRPNLPEAARWYTRALAHRIPLAARVLGSLYENGQGVERDPEKAFELTELAAQQGDADAQNHLGWMLQTGVGVEVDGEEAVQWYLLAEKKGNPTAMGNLALCSLNGDCGVYKSASDALQRIVRANIIVDDPWLKKILRDTLNVLRAEGHRPFCQAVLAASKQEGFFHTASTMPEDFFGMLVAHNDKEKAQCEAFAQALVAARRPSSVDALAWHFYTGQFVPFDLQKVREYLAQVADAKDREYLQATIFSIAGETEEERIKAEKTLRNLADEKDPQADFVLASRYARGLGEDVDEQQGMRYYNLWAVETGHPEVYLESDLEKAFLVKHPEVDEAKLATAVELAKKKGKDQFPSPMLRTKPFYPEELRLSQLEGNVLLEFTVTTDGRVSDVKIRQSSHPLFGAAAVASVREWRFTPAIKSGACVAAKVSLPISFSLNDFSSSDNP